MSATRDDPASARTKSRTLHAGPPSPDLLPSLLHSIERCKALHLPRCPLSAQKKRR
ncbi:hypothetical protein ACFW1A_14460 [Kitasatospora sp. NPDC058965]|uniref:hypothetical protein n=1 Tax=Kitasatospora sp. NPDC058965 TaxID=3346682 RepID=UPI003675F7A7